MPLFYTNQGYVERLSARTTQSSYRLSDQRNALFGGRGSKYDELVYLRGRNADSETVNTKLSGAWTKFSQANGVPTNTDRVDQMIREFTVLGTFPV